MESRSQIDKGPAIHNVVPIAPWKAKANRARDLGRINGQDVRFKSLGECRIRFWPAGWDARSKKWWRKGCADASACRQRRGPGLTGSAITDANWVSRLRRAFNAVEERVQEISRPCHLVGLSGCVKESPHKNEKASPTCGPYAFFSSIYELPCRTLNTCRLTTCPGLRTSTRHILPPGISAFPAGRP
jgi:hypothetical protein